MKFWNVVCLMNDSGWTGTKVIEAETEEKAIVRFIMQHHLYGDLTEDQKDIIYGDSTEDQRDRIFLGGDIQRTCNGSYYVRNGLFYCFEKAPSE